MDIVSHYKKLYGEPERVARFTDNCGTQIHIYKFGLAQNPDEVAIYATDGARHISSLGIEYFIGIRPEVDEIVDAVAEVAIEGKKWQTPPKPGDSITLSFPIWNNSKASTLMFSNGDEIIPDLTVGPRTIRFIKLVPLFPEELEFKKEFGAERLWQHFIAHRVAYWSSNRVSSI